MPIYEYRCAKCGFQKEYLQRISEPPIAKCPECGKKTFKKLVSAAGFQLKGTGWYATDFKNSGSSKKSADKADGSGKESSAKEPAKESASKDSGSKESKSESSTTSAAGGS